MIVAKTIAMVRWYAFEAEDVELRGDTAFVGDNGVGKSSILDAVQLLLTGGNRKFFRPNARADDRKQRTGRRTIRDYCLGKMANAQGAVQLRGGGSSYIVMTVFNEERRQPLSFGIALYADPEQGDATIDGLFIAPGRELGSTHFLIGQERGAAAAPWVEVKKHLEQETPGFRSFREQHSAFIKALLQHMRGRGAVAESEQWLRALGLGAQFRGVEDPNQFVRDHILPDDPLDLPALREDARRYSDLLRTIRDLEEKEQQLQVVQTDFAAYFKKDSDARRGYALAAMARREGVRRQIEIGEAAIRGYRLDENSLAARVELNQERVETARRRVEDSKHALRADPTSGHLATEKARRREAQVALDQANAALSAMRKTFADAARWLADAEQAGIGGSSALRTRFAAAADLHAPADLWPRDIEAASALVPAMETLFTETEAALATASSHQAEARTKLTDSTDRLEAARAGGPILGKEATRLIDALRAEGMDPIPLCGVAEVTDPAWAAAVETLLGAGREAILLERDQVRAAVRRIRRQRSEFWGCIIVQVIGVERFAGNPSPGSLAEMVQASDPRARAFVNQRLGGIRRVKTEAELEGAERAVTADCQYAAGGGIQNRRTVERLILGRRYDAADVDRLTAERDQAASAYQAAAGRMRAISMVQARLRDAAEALGAVPDLEAGLKSRRAANDELDLAAIAIADLERALPVELKRAVADAKRDLDEYAADLEHAREARQSNQVALAKAETTLETHKRDLDVADAALAGLPATPPERSEAVRMLEERLAGRHATTSIAEQATREADVAAADAKTCLNAARRGLLHYWQRYNEASLAAAAASTTPGEAEGEARWVSERLERLRSHELRQYKEAVVEIEAKVRRGLRENLFLALSSRIDHAKEMIQDLNRHLRNRRFHRERYVFTLQPRPEFAEIFQAITAARRDPGLFDDGFIVDGDEAVRRGVDRVVRMLEAEGEAADIDIETLADYRNYFTYDVEMRHETTDAFITTLSERIRTGSGGEKEAPSYVAVGTAIAAANGIGPRHQRHDVGMAIAIFDEAFTRLDDANIGNILDLLRQLGLQMLVAAPTSKRFAFASRFDTVVDVLRVGEHVTLHTYHLDEKARRLMREDNPYEQSFEEWSATRSRSAAAD